MSTTTKWQTCNYTNSSIKISSIILNENYNKLNNVNSCLASNRKCDIKNKINIIWLHKNSSTTSDRLLFLTKLKHTLPNSCFLACNASSVANRTRGNLMNNFVLFKYTYIYNLYSARRPELIQLMTSCSKFDVKHQLTGYLIYYFLAYYYVSDFTNTQPDPTHTIRYNFTGCGCSSTSCPPGHALNHVITVNRKNINIGTHKRLSKLVYDTEACHLLIWFCYSSIPGEVI